MTKEHHHFQKEIHLQMVVFSIIMLVFGGGNRLKSLIYQRCRLIGPQTSNFAGAIRGFALYVANNYWRVKGRSNQRCKLILYLKQSPFPIPFGHPHIFIISLPLWIWKWVVFSQRTEFGRLCRACARVKPWFKQKTPRPTVALGLGLMRKKIRSM